MSQHLAIIDTKKYVFGWDQPLQSFYLQVHDTTLENEDENPIIMLGADIGTTMYEVEDLVRAAEKQGLAIQYNIQAVLYADKDEGR